MAKRELWQTLKVGDIVRLVEYPSEFLHPGIGIHPETVEVYTRLVASKRRLRIDRVEHGGPWTRFSFRRKEGGLEIHYLLLNHGGIARVKPRVKNT